MYNVLIVDDDTLMRNALRAMISRFKNFQIIGEAANGAEAIAICRLYPVHLIFMDIIMPGMTGIEAGKKIKEDSPQTEICILSAYSDFHFAKEAMELHNAIKKNTITDTTSPDTNLEAIKKEIVAKRNALPPTEKKAIKEKLEAAGLPTAYKNVNDKDILMQVLEMFK